MMERADIARYAAAMIGAAVLTLALFYIIVLLIAFNGRIPDNIARVSVKLDTPPKAEETEPSAKARKLQEQSRALKQEVIIPPSPATKTSLKSQYPPAKTAVQISFAPSFDVTKKVSLDITRPNLSRFGKPGRGQNSALGAGGNGERKGFGDTPDIGGERQCTIIFEVGAQKTEIKNIQWIDCMNARIVNAAEIEVYSWVESADVNYLALNPQTGDQIEFTYEEK